MRNITSPSVHGLIFIIGFPIAIGFPKLLVVYILLILYRLLRHRYRSYLRILDVRFLRNLFYAIFAFAIFSLIFLDNDKRSQTDILYFVGIFLLLPGIIFHTISSRMWKRLEQRHSRYDELLMEDKLTHIQEFADRMLIHPNYIRNDFRYLIVSGELDNVYFDEKTDQVFIREEDPYEYDDEDDDLDLDEDFDDDDSDDMDYGENNGSNSEVAASMSPPPPPPPPPPPSSNQSPKKIRCSSCGAPTVLRPNEYTSCKYCGTPISYN